MLKVSGRSREPGERTNARFEITDNEDYIGSDSGATG